MAILGRTNQLSLANDFAAAPARSLNTVLLVAFALLSIGLLMMTSASVEIANSSSGDPFYFLKRQSVFALIGLAASAITLAIPLSLWRQFSFLLVLLSYIFLIAVLIPGIGKSVNGSARWIDLGFFDLQPSELAKLFLVIFTADYLQKNYQAVSDNWRHFLIPLGVSGVAAWLLQREPDHGALVILMATTFCLLFLAGARLWRILLIVLIAGIGFTAIAIKKPHVLARFTSFQDPWAIENVYGDGYQLAQALIAFGRGEWFGTGLGNSIQKLYFLPEAHTDFIFPVIGEELGLLTTISILLTFLLLFFSVGLKLRQVSRMHEYLLAMGALLFVVLQAIINIGVVTGCLPTKGMSLPFISYGGSNLVVTFVFVGLVINVMRKKDNPSPIQAREL
ncbi:MAG: putative lipid II flippase FtsW [Opitutales bacterium]|nr:putative lipid II flippase FtsW [Opitutales bacterium]